MVGRLKARFTKVSLTLSRELIVGFGWGEVSFQSRGVGICIDICMYITYTQGSEVDVRSFFLVTSIRNICLFVV